MASSRSSANSVGVRCTAAPSRRTCWLARSISSWPMVITGGALCGAVSAGRVRRSVAVIRASSSSMLNGLVR